MPASDKPSRPRRVLVALDSSPASGAALEIAAGIAAANAWELSGLFVEDQDLLRLAGLPFTREIQLARAMRRSLAPETLLRDLRAQATMARAAIERQAALHRLSWTFQVTQGRSEEAVLLAASAGDIIAMARRFGPLAEVGRRSGRLRDIAARAPGPLLLAGEPSPGRPGPVLLPYDASPAAAAALDLAVAVATGRGQPLEIMLIGGAARRAQELEARLHATGRRPPSLRLWAPRDAAAALRRLLQADREVIVLPASVGWLTPDQVERVVERSRATIVLQTDLAPA